MPENSPSKWTVLWGEGQKVAVPYTDLTHTTGHGILIRSIMRTTGEKKENVSGPFTHYFKAVRELNRSEATEYTLRTPLQNLLNALSSHIKPLHEPKRDPTKLGAPDFKFKLHEAIVGYLETKKVDEDLDTVLKSAQIAKYKKLSGNIILTNYLEWIWLKDGHIAKRETLCYLSDAGNHRASLDKDKADKVAGLIADFLSTPPQKLADAKNLAKALAVRCHDLRDFLLEELERQDKENQEGRLHGLYASFKNDVFHELALKEFADAFAQTLGYGLFLAKLNAGERTEVSLQNAKKHVPINFEVDPRVGGFPGRIGTGRIPGCQMAGGRNPQYSKHAGLDRHS